MVHGPLVMNMKSEKMILVMEMMKVEKMMKAKEMMGIKEMREVKVIEYMMWLL